MVAGPGRGSELRYADRLLAGIHRSTREERAELMDFRARMYGPKSVHADPEYVRWLYHEAPGAAARGPALWTFRFAGRIEAQQGAIFTRVRVGGSDRRMVWPLELVVSPAHRLRGVGGVMPKLALEETDVAAGTEVSDAAQKTFLRLGWTHLGTLPQWVRPLDPMRFLRARTNRVPDGLGVLDAPAHLLLKTLGILPRALAIGRRLVPMDRFDSRADEVWKKSSPHWPVIARRDAEWLSWRWDRCPVRAGARGVWLVHGDETVGWAVLRSAHDRGLFAGTIVDLLCPPSELASLMELCVEDLAREGVAAVYCLLRAPGVDRAMMSCGFVQRDSRLAMLACAPGLPPEERALVLDTTKWFVTSADSNLDRPRVGTVYAKS